jgi:hypothetical protein
MPAKRSLYLLPSPWPYKIFLFAFFAVGYVACYIHPNFNSYFVPVELPRTWIDRNTPFLPWTFFLYTSDYVLLFFAIALMTDRRNFHRLARRSFLALFIGGAFFYLWPTSLGALRPERPISEWWFLDWIMRLVHELDGVTNCFPSMHVAFTGLAAWSLRYRGRTTFLVFSIWSALVFASVLTTKQHYSWDILGGLLVIVAACNLDNWLVGTQTVGRLFNRWQNNRMWDLSLIRLPI